jgi:hypothetical protein
MGEKLKWLALARRDDLNRPKRRGKQAFPQRRPEAPDDRAVAAVAADAVGHLIERPQHRAAVHLAPQVAAHTRERKVISLASRDGVAP